MNDERWVSFGGSRVRLVCRHLDWERDSQNRTRIGRIDADLGSEGGKDWDWAGSVDFLLEAMPQDQGDNGEGAHTTLTLSRSDDGAWRVAETVFDDLGCVAEVQSALPASASPYERTAHLLGRICHGLADRSRPGALFHAGAVAWGGRQIVIPGGVGRGKSTLTAWLALHGGRYLSDELVYWPSTQEPFEALARPLNLRWAGWQALQPGLTESKLDEILGRSLHQIGEGILISPPSLPAQTSAGGDPPLLLFPHFQPQTPLTLERLSPARTGKALMETLVNGRNLSDHGFGLAVQLAARIPAWRLTYGGFDQLDDAFWTQLRP